MTNEQIIKKAIEKAEKKGFVNYAHFEFTPENSYPTIIIKRHPFEIIFSHDFAKPFFGEKDYWYETPCTCGGIGVHVSDDSHSSNCNRPKAKRGYKFHLQQMVLELQPLKYLEKFLNEEKK